MLSQNGKHWLLCAFLMACVLVDCFFISRVRLFYRTYLLIFVFLISVCYCVKDFCEMRNARVKRQEQQKKVSLDRKTHENEIEK